MQERSRVLVTGASGFIGQFVLLDLLEKNYDVIALDDYSNSDPSSYEAIKKIVPNKSFQIVESSFANEEIIIPLLKQCCVVIHLAAKKSVFLSVERPFEFIDTNIADTIKLLKFCEIAGVRKFIFSSSSSVYGECAQCLEDSQLKPSCPYGFSKLVIDQTLEQICKVKKD